MNTSNDWRAGVRAGMLAGGLSLMALAVRSRTDTGSVAAALNAPSHWLWGDRALREQGWSWKYTGTGVAIHQASALLWGVLHQRRRAASENAVAAAASTTAGAAFVDLALTPRRFTPGFERRLSPAGLVWVYALFATGLCAASVLQSRRDASAARRR